ncbi:MAG: hypothetical protein ACK41Q_08580 [Candidatus Brocadia sp.]
MIYQELLYSRSFSKDYRWMIVPQNVSMDNLKALNLLYNMYDKYKDAFSKSSVLPLYCLNHTDATFLVSCGLSNHKDKDGRDIYCLQGISVPHEYRRHFWFILPWILANYEGKGLLNTWKNIDFSSADDIVRRASVDHSFKLDQLDESLAKLTQTPGSSSEKLPVNVPTYISFDKSGLKELSHLLSSYHDCMDFAFGVTPEMTKNFDFKIIAKAGIRPRRKNNTEMERAENTSSFAPVDRDKAIHELLDDPIDRFDPRKKKGGMVNKVKLTRSKNKLFWRNGSSRIVSQFFPRLLSVFKIGKKLKRPKSSGQQ